jgi:hypothetical protein
VVNFSIGHNFGKPSNLGGSIILSQTWFKKRLTASWPPEETWKIPKVQKIDGFCLFTIRRPKTTAQLRRIQDTTHSKKRTQGSPWISWQLQVASKHSKEHTTWHTQRGFTTAMVYLKIGYALW